MPHRIDYSGDGTRARVTLDVNGASLDSDANPIGSEWQTLKNVLTHLSGPLRKRGAITKPINNVLTPATFNGFGVYKGPLRGGVDRDVNLGVTSAGSFYWETDGSSAGTGAVSALLNSPGYATGPEAMTTAVMAEDCLIFTGSPGNPVVGKYGGSTLTVVNTGTATMTTGSKTVTLSSALTAGEQTAAVGAFILNTQDSSSTRFCYQITAVNSSTEIVIDRNYAGSRSAAASTFEIKSVARLYKNSATVGAYSDLACQAVTAAWNRLVLLEPSETSSTGSEARVRGRVRWSGALWSDDGTAPYTGMHGYHADGYLDLPSEYGDLVNGFEFGDAFVVLAKRRLVVLNGDPVFDGVGSLSVTGSYPASGFHDRSVGAKTRSACVCPYGVFFYDRKAGAMLWDNTGPPRPLSSRRVLTLIRSIQPTEVGYYNDHVFFLSSTGGLLYSILTDSWSEIAGDTNITHVQPGRDTGTDSTSQYLAGVSSSRMVVNLANVIDNPGVEATDWNGTAFTVDVKSGKIGDTLTHLRPERMYVTYRLTDLTTTNPYLAATVTTGLPDTSDAAHTYTNNVADLTETVDVETKTLELALDRDPMMQLRLLQVNGAGKLEIFAVVVDCAVEGESGSS